jgi:hypothetical protein
MGDVLRIVKDDPAIPKPADKLGAEHRLPQRVEAGGLCGL